MHYNIVHSKMSSWNLLVFSSMALSSFFASHALKMEELVGGGETYYANHMHQAAIMGKYLRNEARYLICSACIIGEFHMLSASHCFFHTSNRIVKKLKFFALVGSLILTPHEPPELPIEQIFIPGDFYETFNNDIAVSKLKNSLNLLDNVFWISLPIAYPGQRFNTLEGLVAGYGSKEYNPLIIAYAAQQRISLSNIPELTYAYAAIISDNDCENAHSEANTLVHMCAVIPPNNEHSTRGLCLSDGGVPLVIEGTVVGIAGKNNPDCNDTVRGALYSKVASYGLFINTVLLGNYEGSIYAVQATYILPEQV